MCKCNVNTLQETILFKVTFLETRKRKRLSVSFTGLTKGIHDSLDVKTSKLAFRTKSEEERRQVSTVFLVGGECKKCV